MGWAVGAERAGTNRLLARGTNRLTWEPDSVEGVPEKVRDWAKSVPPWVWLLGLLLLMGED